VDTPRHNSVLKRAGKPIKTPNWRSYEITYGSEGFSGGVNPSGHTVGSSQIAPTR